MLLDVVECYTFCLFIFILLSLPPVLLAGSIFNCWRVSTLSHHTQHSLALSLRIKFLSSHSIEIETLFLTSMLGVIWLGINGCYKRLDEYSGNVIRQPWVLWGWSDAEMMRDENLLDKRKAAHVMDKAMTFVSPQQPTVRYVCVTYWEQRKTLSHYCVPWQKWGKKMFP